MTCVEYTPSNEPGYTERLVLSIDERNEQDDKNLLFANNSDYTLTDDAITSICDGLDINESDGILHQYSSESDYRNKGWKDGDISFVIEKDGGFSSGTADYVNYKITAYVDYGKNRTATCVGSVSKPALCE
jgi:hypothetical protein